jgi:UDP-N-acetylmuramoylalanine--D-glutamate ligase
VSVSAVPQAAGTPARPRRGLVERLRGARVHVVGASGVEGAATLVFLAGVCGIQGVVAHDFAPDWRAFATSFRRANSGLERDSREEALARLRRLPVEFRLGSGYLRGIESADVILASQNWFNHAVNRPAVPDAVARGASLLGVVDLAMDVFPGTRAGVSGSNGKSTTTALLAHLLRAGLAPGRRVLHGGNDRARQVSLAELRAASPGDVLVWEVSNRHLRDRAVPLDVAVLTNVTRNHVEDHGSFEAYVEAKARLLLAPGPGGDAVMSAVDPISKTLLDRVLATGCRVWRFGGEPDEQGHGTAGPLALDQGAAWAGAAPSPALLLRRPGEASACSLGPLSAFPLPGRHNQENLLAALCGAAAVLGASDGAAERLGGAVRDFVPLPDRMQEVAAADGVRWVYDIQATTAPAAEAGILASGEAGQRVILLVGGEDKGMDFAGMAQAAARYADLVLALPGSGADAFLRALGDRVAVEHWHALDPALRRARAAARPGSTVQLSPGCAFFFSRYIDGGPTFAERVRAVLGEGTGER